MSPIASLFYLLLFSFALLSCTHDADKFEIKGIDVSHYQKNIDWAKYVTNMGAPNVGGKSIIVRAYTDYVKKNLTIIDKHLRDHFDSVRYR